jgi:hypothetical protein
MGGRVHEEVGEDEEADYRRDDADLLVGLLRNGRDVLDAHMVCF